MKALILAGGEAKSMGAMGQHQSKHLLPVPTDTGVKPIINGILDKLLEIEEIKKILILLGNEYKDQFQKWLAAYYSTSESIDLQFEDDLQQQLRLSSNFSRNDLQSDPGAIWGLYLAIKTFEAAEPLLIVAGDNYFTNYLTNSFSDLVQAFARTPQTTIAYHDLQYQELVLDRYGVIEVDKSDRIVSFLEKPGQLSTDEPSRFRPSKAATKVAIACYILTNQDQARLLSYVEKNEGSLKAPGHFFQWLIKKEKIDVNGFEFKERWWDIGTPADYADVLRIMSRFEIRTVSDLIKAKREMDLPDSYFLVGRRFEFEIKNDRRTMRVIFEENDSLCKKSSATGDLITPKQIQGKSSAMKDESDNLKKAINSPSESSYKISFPADSGLLLSGGVFLYDSRSDTVSPDTTFIPLLERDFGAQEDAGRLTTPAGRMDDINLRALCYSELLEEFVFYGLNDLNNVKLRTVFPDDLSAQYRPKTKLINRLLHKNILIPGIDSRTLEDQSKRSEDDIDIVEVLEPLPIHLPVLQNLPIWEVKIEIEGHQSLSAGPVYVIFDEPNCTIEFRKVVFADISKFSSRAPQGRPKGLQGVNTFGRLLGIIDGDGYRRRTFLMSAGELANYYENIQNAFNKTELIEKLLSSQKKSVHISAVGDGADAGRFILFDAPVPALFLTTSVRELAKLTSNLLAMY